MLGVHSVQLHYIHTWRKIAQFPLLFSNIHCIWSLDLTLPAPYGLVLTVSVSPVSVSISEVRPWFWRDLVNRLVYEFGEIRSLG